MKDDTNCVKPTDYPLEIHWPTVEIINDHSTISCGGNDYTKDKNPTSDHFEYNIITSQ